MAESVQASTVEIPTSTPFNGKILAGIFAGLGIPALFAAGGGGSKGSNKDPEATADNTVRQTADNSDNALIPQSVAQPIAMPSEKTVETPTEQLSEKSAEIQTGQSPEKPAETPTEQPSEKTAEISTDKPSEKFVENTPSEKPNEPEPVVYTTNFSLSNGLSFSIVSENEAADIHKQGYQDSLRPLTYDEVQELAAQSTVNIEKVDDRDGDGLIDSEDPHPDYWNVSDRDLRMFATVAYATEGKAELQRAFNGGSDKLTINSVKTHFNEQVDINEYQGHWEVLDVTNKDDLLDSGLDYMIFGNGRKDNGSYENVVVSFRGTKNFQDVTADIKLALGKTPTQAKQMVEIIEKLAKYNPDHIFSTGHSLGGYLAQYFATHTVQNSQFKDQFVRSVLFNPAVIVTDESSTPDLIQAQNNTFLFLNQKITDTKFANQSGTTYKTNSYVIDGEWVSKGIIQSDGIVATVAKGVATAAAKTWGMVANILSYAFTGKSASKNTTDLIDVAFDGLGEYKNTIFLKDTAVDRGVLGKHALANFYETSTEVQKYFSQGYRVDNTELERLRYRDSDGDGLTDYQERLIGTNPNNPDTDGDNFSDGIEVKLETDALAKDDIPIRPEALYEHAQTLALKAETQSSDGSSHSDSAVLIAEVDKNSSEIAYRADNNISAPSDSPLTLSGITLIHGTSGNDTITGSSGNDRIYGGLGSDRLIGGGGADTFVFDSADLADGHVDTVVDFNAAFDKLDFSGMKDLFADGREFDFNWSEVLVEGIQNNTSHAYLVFDHTEQTLSYQAKGGETGSVFVRFEGENVHLGADQIV